MPGSISVRLVKGAYWDYENIMASQRAWKSPVFLRKVETDANYEKCTEFLMDAYPALLPAFRSCRAFFAILAVSVDAVVATVVLFASATALIPLANESTTF